VRFIRLGDAIAVALGVSALALGAAADPSNDCGANVSHVAAYQDKDRPDVWMFTFHVVQDKRVGSCGFKYSFTFVDSHNVPHLNNAFQGPIWTTASGREFDVSATQNLADAGSIRDVRISSVYSGGCST
jgi:hypothetical protein